MKPFEINPVWKDQIPERSAQVLERYVNFGGDLSTFYTRLLSGDAFGAACNADAENLAAMGFLLNMIGQDFPSECYGSSQAVSQWRGLMQGQERPFSVPESWQVVVEELRREGAKTYEQWQEEQESQLAKRVMN